MENLSSGKKFIDAHSENIAQQADVSYVGSAALTIV